MRSLLVVLLFLGVVVGGEVTTHVFAQRESGPLLLDIYRPAQPRNAVLVYVHGGAWRAGSRAQPPCLALLQAGYTIVSVDYRLSPVAPFPAQVFDIRAAIRYLRINHIPLELDARNIILVGTSAGGHLATLVGVSEGVAELAGEIGDDRHISTEVQGIVSYFGAGNLTTILSQSTPHGLSVREPALRLFIGGLPNEQPELARLASPITHVDASDPPLL
jgi:acetyl esterase/lipase